MGSSETQNVKLQRICLDFLLKYGNMDPYGNTEFWIHIGKFLPENSYSRET